jgi:hypothetical protein
MPDPTRRGQGPAHHDRMLTPRGGWNSPQTPRGSWQALGGMRLRATGAIPRGVVCALSFVRLF